MTPQTQPQYEVTLPLFDNSGNPTQTALSQWEAVLLDWAGGYTTLPIASGYWKGPDGTVYADTVQIYRIACHPAQFEMLLQRAQSLFPDQEALYAAEVGRAWLVTKGNVVMPLTERQQAA